MINRRCKYMIVIIYLMTIKTFYGYGEKGIVDICKKIEEWMISNEFVYYDNPLIFSVMTIRHIVD